MEQTPEPQIASDIEEIEFDEMSHFIEKKSQKLWIIKALDRRNRRTIAWATGDRDAATFKRLFEKLKHCIFYTDDWEAFAKVLPKNQDVLRKKETVTIERDDRNTRHHLRRITRRTKIVSKKEEIVCGSIKLWCALTIPEIFSQYQATFLSIFR